MAKGRKSPTWPGFLHPMSVFCRIISQLFWSYSYGVGNMDHLNMDFSMGISSRVSKNFIAPSRFGCLLFCFFVLFLFSFCLFFFFLSKNDEILSCLFYSLQFVLDSNWKPFLYLVSSSMVNIRMFEFLTCLKASIIKFSFP